MIVTLGMVGILSQSTTAWLDARKDRVSQMFSKFSSISSCVSWLAMATCSRQELRSELHYRQEQAYCSMSLGRENSIDQST